MTYKYWKIYLMLIAAALCCNEGVLESFVIAGQASQENLPASGPAREFRPQTVTLQAQLLNCQAGGSGIWIDLKGSDLMPAAKGDIKAKSSGGSTSIEANFENLGSPAKLGEQYMVYVLWSLTAQDIPQKLGALELKDTRGTLKIKSIMQVLALFVTAEPYIEVAQPSSLVVLEQVGPRDTPMANTGVVAKAKLLKDGYAPIGYTFEPLREGIGQPPLFRQALNARRIALLAQADKHARKEFAQGEDLYRYLLSVVRTDKRPKKSTLDTAVIIMKYYDQARAAAINRQAAPY
jgi:hypothetical protein